MYFRRGAGYSKTALTWISNMNQCTKWPKVQYGVSMSEFILAKIFIINFYIFSAPFRVDSGL